MPGLTSKSKKRPTPVHNQSSGKEPKELVVLYNHGFQKKIKNSNNNLYNLWSFFLVLS
jgi:hypothetical protein